MIRAGVYLLSSALAASSAVAEDIEVPSGISVTRQEILHDMLMGELWLRFRYVAPRIGKEAGSVTFDVAVIDIDYLCDEDAVPHVLANDLAPARIVVSMADRVMDFGATDPNATQFFGAYRLENQRCIWEEF